MELPKKNTATESGTRHDANEARRRTPFVDLQKQNIIIKRIGEVVDKTRTRAGLLFLGQEERINLEYYYTIESDGIVIHDPATERLPEHVKKDLVELELKKLSAILLHSAFQFSDLPENTKNLRKMLDWVTHVAFSKTQVGQQKKLTPANLYWIQSALNSNPHPLAKRMRALAFDHWVAQPEFKKPAIFHDIENGDELTNLEIESRVLHALSMNVNDNNTLVERIHKPGIKTTIDIDDKQRRISIFDLLEGYLRKARKAVLKRKGDISIEDDINNLDYAIHQILGNLELPKRPKRLPNRICNGIRSNIENVLDPLIISAAREKAHRSQR